MTTAHAVPQPTHAGFIYGGRMGIYPPQMESQLDRNVYPCQVLNLPLSLPVSALASASGQ